MAQIISEERSTGMGATRFSAILTGGDEEFGSFEQAHRWAASQSAPLPPTIDSVLGLAAHLPAGLNDARAAEKLLAERDELTAALAANDQAGALTEAADAVYYAVKHLDWVAGQVDCDIETLFRLAVAKYSLRARPGNPKDDAAERAACAAVR